MKRSRQSLGYVLCMLSAALWAINASAPRAAEPSGCAAHDEISAPAAADAAIPTSTNEAAPLETAPAIATPESEECEHAAMEPDWEALVAEEANAQIQAAEQAACMAAADELVVETTWLQKTVALVGQELAEARELAAEYRARLLDVLANSAAEQRAAAELVEATDDDSAGAAATVDSPAVEDADYGRFVDALEQLRLPEAETAQGPVTLADNLPGDADPMWRGCDPPAPGEITASERPSTAEYRSTLRPVLSVTARVLDRVGQSLVELSRSLDQAGAGMSDDAAIGGEADPELPPTVGRNTIPESIYGL